MSAREAAGPHAQLQPLSFFNEGPQQAGGARGPEAAAAHGSRFSFKWWADAMSPAGLAPTAQAAAQAAAPEAQQSSAFLASSGSSSSPWHLA